MGNSARDNNAYGGGQAAARPPSVKRPNAMAKAPGVMTEALKGTVGQAWSPAQTTAGGRWEVPAGAPAGAIGRNWVPYTPPAPVEPRQQLATMMSPSPNPYARDGMNVHNPFYSRTNPDNPYFSHGRPSYPGASGR